MIHSKHTILFVGLDPDRAAPVSTAVRDMGAVPLLAETAPCALALLMPSGPDLIVLDDAGSDVHRLCRTIRQRTCRPLVVLAAAENAALHASVLADGADDVILKPCPVVELAARLAALLRRAAWNEPDAEKVIACGSVRLDCQHDRLWLQGDWIDLTAVESRGLAYLLQRAGQPVAKAELARAIWGWGRLVEQTELIDRVLQDLQHRLASVGLTQLGGGEVEWRKESTPSHPNGPPRSSARQATGLRLRRSRTSQSDHGRRSRP